MDSLLQRKLNKASKKARKYAQSIFPSMVGQQASCMNFSGGTRVVYATWCMASNIRDMDETQSIRKLLHAWACDMEKISSEIPEYEVLYWRSVPEFTIEELPVRTLKLRARFGFRNIELKNIMFGHAEEVYLERVSGR